MGTSDERRARANDGKRTPSEGKARAGRSPDEETEAPSYAKRGTPSQGKAKAARGNDDEDEEKNEKGKGTPSASRNKAIATPSGSKTKRLGTPSEGKRGAARGGQPAPANNLLVPVVVGAGIVGLLIGFIVVHGTDKKEDQQANVASAEPTTLAPATKAPAPETTAPAPATKAPSPDLPTATEKALKAVSEAERLERDGKPGDAIASLDLYLTKIAGTGEETYVSNAREAIVHRLARALDPVDDMIRLKQFAKAKDFVAKQRKTLPPACSGEIEAVLQRIAGAEEAARPTKKPPKTDEDPVPSKDPEATPDPEPKPTKKPPKEPAKDPAKDPPKDPSKDPSSDPSSPEGEGVKDFKITEKVWKIEELLYLDPPDLLGAAKLVAELEKEFPNSTQMRGVRGTVAFAQGRFTDCQEDLAAALKADPKDDQIRGDLACSYYYLGKYEQAREIALPGINPSYMTQRSVNAKRKVITRCGNVVSLIDGPFLEKYPLAHSALEVKHPNGRYTIVTNMGLPEGAIDKLEKDLGAASPASRQAMIDRFKKNHQGLQDLITIYDAAFKSYGRIFKPAIQARDKERQNEKGKTTTGAAQGATAQSISNRRDDIVARVFVFETKPEFATFSEKIGLGSMEHAAGYYLPSYKSLFFYNDPRNRKGQPTGEKKGTIYLTSLDTLLHETFHQYCHLFIEDIPTWFNEGLAEYFGNSELQRDRIHPCIPNTEYSRYQQLLRSRRYGELKPLREVIGMDHSTFMFNADATYPTSWAFCYYLASSKQGRKRLNDYLNGLLAGVSQEDLNKKIFSDIDTLQTEWDDFIGHMTNASIDEGGD